MKQLKLQDISLTLTRNQTFYDLANNLFNDSGGSIVTFKAETKIRLTLVF